MLFSLQLWFGKYHLFIFSHRSLNYPGVPKTTEQFEVLGDSFWIFDISTNSILLPKRPTDNSLLHIIRYLFFVAQGTFDLPKLPKNLCIDFWKHKHSFPAIFTDRITCIKLIQSIALYQENFFQHNQCKICVWHKNPDWANFPEKMLVMVSEIKVFVFLQIFRLNPSIKS